MRHFATATDYQDLVDQIVDLASSQNAASATVAAGGSGYVVGDILTLSGGTSTHVATFKVTTVSSGAVTAVTPVNGGAYTTPPGNPVSTTGGTGTGCTLTVTFADTGWTIERETTYTFNSIADEREIVLNGEGSGSDNIYVGFRTFTVAVGLETAYNMLVNGMTGFNGALDYTAQAGISPGSTPGSGGGAYVPLENDSMDFWVWISTRRIILVVKTSDVSTTHYQSMYAGFLDPFQTASEFPYPIYISGCSARYDALWDTTLPDVGGIVEQIGISGRHGPGYTRKANGVWETVANSFTTISPVARGINQDFTIYPAGENRLPPTNDSDEIVGDGAVSFDDFCPNTGVPGAPTVQILPSEDSGGDKYPLIPATLIWTSADEVDRNIVGHLNNVFWVPSGGVLTPEDTLESEAYLVFSQGQRSEVCSFMAIKDE